MLYGEFFGGAGVGEFIPVKMKTAQHLGRLWCLALESVFGCIFSQKIQAGIAFVALGSFSGREPSGVGRS